MLIVTNEGLHQFQDIDLEDYFDASVRGNTELLFPVVGKCFFTTSDTAAA